MGPSKNGIDATPRPDFVRAWIESCIRFEQSGQLDREMPQSRSQTPFSHPVKTHLMGLGAGVLSGTFGKRGVWHWALEKQRLAGASPQLLDDLFNHWERVVAEAGGMVHPMASVELLEQRLGWLDGLREKMKTESHLWPTWNVPHLEGTGTGDVRQPLDWFQWMDVLSRSVKLPITGPFFAALFGGQGWDRVLDGEALSHWNTVKDSVFHAHAEAVATGEAKRQRNRSHQAFATLSPEGQEKLRLAVMLLPDPGQGPENPSPRRMRL